MNLMSIPRAPLLLGLAGLLPFIAGAAVSTMPPFEPQENTYPLLTARDGERLLEHYGIIILCFMSGVLWGFATKSDRAWPYILSVLPALWVLGNATGKPTDVFTALLVGFIGVFGLDVIFHRSGLTPEWWLKLRAILTVIVCGCLLIGLVL